MSDDLRAWATKCAREKREKELAEVRAQVKARKKRTFWKWVAIYCAAFGPPLLILYWTMASILVDSDVGWHQNLGSVLMAPIVMVVILVVALVASLTNPWFVTALAVWAYARQKK